MGAVYGTIPNLHRKMATSPSLVAAYWSASQAFGKSSLTHHEQQVVLIAVSVANGCAYCVGAHSALADMVKLPSSVTEALRNRQPIPEPRFEVLRRFTEAVVEKRGWVETSDVDAFLASGFTHQQVLEVVLGVGLKTLSNYTNHIVDTELDSAFRDRSWTARKSS
ncbi:MAG: carboxymuconolactone decarboxylase family protein [Candidatus Eisenbacteria bacterium]